MNISGIIGLQCFGWNKDCRWVFHVYDKDKEVVDKVVRQEMGFDEWFSFSENADADWWKARLFASKN